MKRLASSLLFVIPICIVMAAMFSPSYATDSADGGSTVSSYTHRIYVIQSASTTLNSSPISTVGKKKLWLNVYIPENAAGNPVHIGAVTRPIFIEGKLGTLTTTSTSASADGNIGWASTWFTYADSVSSATSATSKTGLTNVIPSRLGMYGPIDIEGIPMIRLCARGIAEASDINVEIGFE
jgi:hypothetical protein